VKINEELHMLRLRDIMTKDVLTVTPDLAVRDAMALLASRHVSGAPVIDGGKVVGVLSSTDLLEFAAALPGVPVAHAEPTDFDVELAAEQIDLDALRESLVAEIWAGAGVDVADRMREAAGHEWNALEEHTVADVMTPTVVSLSPNTSVQLAADLMRSVGIHRVLVMQGDRMLGIVTTKDIANAVADNKLTIRKYVFPPKAEAEAHAWW
jgi:CBS domain-containing protein